MNFKFMMYINATLPQWINSLSPGRCGSILKIVIFKLIFQIDIWWETVVNAT